MGQIDAWGDPDAGQFQVLPEGWYDLKFETITHESSKSSATPQLQCKAKILSGGDGSRIGDTVTIFLSLHEKMVWQVKQVLEALGIHYEPIQGPQGQKGIRFDPDYLQGRIIRAYCNHRDDNQGRRRENWRDWQASAQDPQQAGGAPQQPQQPQQQQPAQAAPPQQQAPQPAAPPAQQPGQGQAPPPAQPKQPGS